MAATAEAEIRVLLLLDAGRVHIRAVDPDTGRILALVDSDSGDGSYTVRRTPDGGWSCSCIGAAYGNRCKHVAAVQLVTTGEG